MYSGPLYFRTLWRYRNCIIIIIIIMGARRHGQGGQLPPPPWKCEAFLRTTAAPAVARISYAIV